MNKYLKVVIAAASFLLAAVLALLLVLTITEYKPEEVADAISIDSGSSDIEPGETITVLSWNIGYAGLGEESDFFMDGGNDVRQSKETTEKNLKGIKEFLSEQGADILLLQEVDINSKRTYGIDETQALSSDLNMSGVFAYNYNCAYVPFPLPTIGHIQSGLLTLSNYGLEESQRISLPCPFSWPVRMANLKRCLLVSRIDLPDSDKQLVMVNLHLEAYDDGKGKATQTDLLRKYIESEYEKGNYVIAGGDFNQTFSGTDEMYPNNHPDLWQPGHLEDSLFPENWSLCCDSCVPTCRLLNQEYNPSDVENTQHYVIDGFILSPNVELLSVNTLDEGFRYSDHNPVKIVVRLS